MEKITRKEFLATSAAAVMSAAGGLTGARAQPMPVGAATARGPLRTLIKQACILTMDDRLGEIEQGDVLIEDTKIVAVERGITADAHIVDGTGMILMPGMVDGHRHLWQDIAKGYQYADYMRNGHLRYALMFLPEDLYLANLIGGLSAIDSGVTSVVDFSHIIHTAPQGEAAARGTIDSGVGGFFCWQLNCAMPEYAKGGKQDAAAAWQQIMGPPDPSQFDAALKIRDRHFSSSEAPLQFGLALSAMEFAKRTRGDVYSEFELARRSEAKLVTQHVLGASGSWRMGQDASYRLVPDLQRGDHLRRGYLVAHGNGLSNEELVMLRDSGCASASCCLGEMAYWRPSIHARARALGLPAALGADTTGWQTHDYFEHIRAARFGLLRDNENTALSRTFSALDYLRIATIDGAKAIGMDSTIGSITPGKRADLVLIRTSRTFFPAFGTAAARVFGYATVADVDSVWIAGRRRKQDGKLLDFDWDNIIARTRVAWDRIVSSAAGIELTGELGPTFPNAQSS